MNTEKLMAKAAEKKSIREELPAGEELVQMTRAEIQQLIEQVREDANRRIDEALTGVEALKAKYEAQEAESYLNRRGQEPSTERLQVMQGRPLGPVDHMDLLANEYRDKLKGKRSRFVTDRPEIVSLRRAQGYDKVKDGDGKEVRYMDSILMAMPEGRHREEVAKPIEERKQLNRRGISERFKSVAANHGIQTDGEGIKYDRGD